MEEMIGKDGGDRSPTHPHDKKGESSLTPPERLSVCICQAVRQLPRPHDKASESPEQAQTAL